MAVDGVATYAINASTGALTLVGLPAAAGRDPSAIAVDPTGRYAYATNRTSNNVSVYVINANSGQLAKIEDMPTGLTPVSIVVDPSGRFVYVANSASTNVLAYTIDYGTGRLTSIGEVPVGANPSSITVDSSGQYAYAHEWEPNNF